MWTKPWVLLNKVEFKTTNLDNVNGYGTVGVIIFPVKRWKIYFNEFIEHLKQIGIMGR